MKKRKIVITVTNDLMTDQRVNRIAETLCRNNNEVIVIGRLIKNSMPLKKRNYKTIRLFMLFKKGPLFYLFYNFRLIIFLIFKKFDIILSVDLDTLAAGYCISKIKRKILVYDSHELFVDLPELQNRNQVKKIWLLLEKLVLPKLKYAITVCDSIADIYYKKYKTSFETIRNVPLRKESENIKAKEITGINKRKVILYQGSINIGRGLENIIDTLPYLENVCFLIIGRGDIEMQLAKYVENKGLTDRVIFTGAIPFEELYPYTQIADVGISLEENLGQNYYFALPNKLFDYIQARIPVLVSAFPEMEKIVKKYNIGKYTLEKDPAHLASALKSILYDENKRAIWLKNLDIAAEDLIWEKEEKKLISFFNGI